MSPAAALRNLSRADTSEEGFTLTELLVVIAVTSIITTVLASSFIIGIGTARSANTRLQESHDAQLASTYFGADVASATQVSTTESPRCSNGTDGTDGTDGTRGTDRTKPTTVALFEWTDPGAPKVGRAAYYYVLTGPPLELRRRYCEGTELMSDVSISKNLSSDPVVSCPGPATANCGTAPADVQLQISEGNDYTYTLRATRRSDASAASALAGGVTGAALTVT
jgi:prepilin-type N-terminal cleavage/methylation domain-containing protein